MKTCKRLVRMTCVSALILGGLLFGANMSRAAFINYTRTLINVTNYGGQSSGLGGLPLGLNLSSIPGVPAGIFPNMNAAYPGLYSSTLTNPYLTNPYLTNPYLTNPYTTNPYLTNPYTTNPYLTNPYTTNPYVTNPYTTNPYVTNPYTTNPYVTNPYATNPYATNPYATNPYATNPYATNPYTTNPYATNPYATNPYTTNPYATNPYATNPYATNPYATNPYATNPYYGTTPGTTTPAATAASLDKQTVGSALYTAVYQVLVQGISILGQPDAYSTATLNAVTNTPRLGRMLTAIQNGTATTWPAVVAVQ